MTDENNYNYMRKINLPVFVFLLILVGVKGDLGFLSISEDSEGNKNNF
jgi:hypothetical protein